MPGAQKLPMIASRLRSPTLLHVNRVILNTVALSVAGLLAVKGETGLQEPGSPEQSHQRMLHLLDEIHTRTPDENAYLGDSKARDLRFRLAQLDSQDSAAIRFDLLIELGTAELNLGNEKVAIQHLEQALALFQLTGKSKTALADCLYQLAIAQLRLGETENCCRQHNPDSCLFPIQGGGIHSRPAPSEKAASYLEQILSAEDLTSDWKASLAWLLNITHMTLGTWPESVDSRWRIQLPSGATDGNSFPAFPNVAARHGLGNFSLAGGVVADDFNGDGRLDLIISDWDSGKDIRYLQQDGDGRFVDYSTEANLTGLSGGLNLLQADYDNDGDLDLYVLRGGWLGKNGNHPNSLLRNEGLGPNQIPRFVDVTFLVGLGERHAPTQAASWGDFDLDGDVDLFVANESRPEYPNPSNLFRNDGGTFVDVAALVGVENHRFSKGCSWGDYDSDGDLDLYISNLDGPNRLYRNYGGTSFIDVAEGLGVGDPFRSFPSWFWDFDNDGNLDIFASNYTSAGRVYWPYYRGIPLADDDIAAIYRGNGKGGFDKVTRQVALDIPMLPMGSNFGDLNNDGFPDFYLGTGTPNLSDLVPNQLLINQSGEEFLDRTIDSRTGNLQKGHAVAFADFDADGDLDIFEQMGGAVPGDGYYDALFENPGFPGTHWLQVRLVGVQTNRFGIGCRIRAVIDAGNGGERTVHQVMNSGGSFGANPLIAHLGLGKTDRVKRLEIDWPVTGETQVLENIPGDRRIRVTEGESSWEPF